MHRSRCCTPERSPPCSAMLILLTREHADMRATEDSLSETLLCMHEMGCIVWGHIVANNVVCLVRRLRPLCNCTLIDFIRLQILL